MAALTDLFYRMNQKSITIIYLNTLDTKKKKSINLDDCLLKILRFRNYEDLYKLVSEYSHIFE